MAQQSFAGLAVLIVLTFAIMALHGCASPEQHVANESAAIIPATSTPEFHGASLGRDTLRSRLPSED
ncbi:MAG: hypothetical protein ACT4OF_09380 [Caulobacteraceae bacterium]